MTHYPQFNNIWCSNIAEKYKMSYMAMGNPFATKTLICVHGLNRNNRDWDFIATMAANSGYYVICPDLVGRGNSDYLVDYSNYQVSNYANDIITLINNLSLRNIDYVGTSLGGIVGMYLAANNPKMLRSLVLNDIGPKIELAGLMRIATYSKTTQEFETLDIAVDALIATSREFGYDMSDDLWHYVGLNSYKISGNGHWELRRDINISKALYALFESGNSFDDFNLWSHIITPTMVIRGADSDILSQNTVDKMKQISPNLHAIEYLNCGHAPFLYNQKHMSDLLEFFNKI